MHLFLVAAIVLAAAARPAAAQSADSLPPGVSAEMVRQGRQLFHGPAICAACHGKDAVGIRGLGPDLSDTTWIHSDGSFEAIVRQITTGVSSRQSTTGITMPPQGGAALTDEQLHAVAAYVWSLRRRG